MANRPVVDRWSVRPSIRWTARIVLPILLLIGAWQVWANIEQRRLARALALLDSAVSDSSSRAERAATHSDFADRYYIAAVAMVAFPRLDTSGTAPSVGDLIKQMRASVVGAGTIDVPTRTRIEETLARNHWVLQLVSQARPFPIEGRVTRWQDVNPFSLLSASQVCALRTLWLVSNGDGDAAVDSLLDRIAMFRSLRVGQGNGMFSGGVKNIVVRDIADDTALVVARTTPAPEKLEALSDALGTIYEDADLVAGLSGFARLEVQMATESKGLDGWRRQRMSVAQPYLLHAAVNAVATANRAVEATKQPWPQRIRALGALKDRGRFAPDFMRQTAQWARDLTHGMATIVALVRCSRVAVALEAYRREHGAFPATLDVVSMSGADEKRDPFTGQDLRYRRTDSGFVLYSVGKDLHDDEGTFVSAPALFGDTRPVDVGVSVGR